MNKKKSETRKEFDKATKGAKWVIVKLTNLPDDCPVLGISTYPNKSIAEFNLIEHVLVPETAIDAMNTDLKIRKTKKESHE